MGTTWNSVVIGATTMTGTMNVGGRTWSDPLTLRTGSGQMNINGNIAMGSSNFTISTDSNLSIGGTLTGSGTLTISPSTLSTSIGLGDGQAGTLHLSDAELNNIVNGWGAIVIGTTGVTGAMNVGARTWQDPLTLRTGSGIMSINGAQTMGANNLTLTTNSNLAINGAISSTGTLTIGGASTATSIGVGDGQAGTLSLTDAELDNLQSGFSSVIIGATNVTGAINIAGRTWNNNMDFRTNTGALNINGAQNMGANNLILRTNTDLVINQILAGTGTLSILNSGTAAANSMAIGSTQSGQLKLTDAELGFITGQGWTTLAFGNNGSAGVLNVDAKSWAENVIFRNGAGTLSINGVQTMAAGKNLTITSNGDIALNFAVDGTGTLTFGPSAATATFGVGDGQAGPVHLSNAELARISANWNLLTFGTTVTTTSTYGTMGVANLNWNHNVRFLNNLQAMSIAGATMAAGKNLTIETNGTLNINGNLNGTGNLTVAPQAAGTTIGVDGAGTLNLSAAELNRFVDGWSEIVIGRTDGTGAMAVGSRTWNDNLRLMSGTGIITIAGADMGANNLSIVTNGNPAINGNLVGTGALTIRTASGLTGIGVGDLQAGALALSNAELGRFVDGWGSVTIGSTNMFGDINIGAYTWQNPMTFVTQGDVILNGVQTSAEASGTTLVFATTAGSFINNAGASAINPGGGRYLVYSVASADDTLGGLTPLTVVDDESYSGYPPGSVVEAGDVFIYSGLAAKILFLSIDDKDKEYGEANPAFSFTYLGGLQGSDTLNDVILAYTLSAPGSTVLDGAGTTRTITGSFTAGLGYIINFAEGVLSVIKATLTVTGDSDTREYGEANPGLSVSYSGFKNGEDVTDLDTEATASTLADVNSDVGSYAITASGASDDNYDFIYVDGALDITKATLTATTQNATREYGDADPTFNITYTGFKNGQNSGVIDTLATGSTAAVANSNVGTYAISGGGGLDNNYDFNYVNTGNLSITKAMLTATTQNATREYGDANPTLSVVYTGFKNSETQSVIDTLATVSTGAIATSNVGTYGISSTGAADINYNFTYVNSGLLSVTKATLTATVQNATREYGDADPAFSVVYTGFKNSETDAVIDTLATPSTAAIATTAVGNHAITATGAADTNYSFTYVDGTLAITKATLTATTQNATREYGAADPTFGVVYTGFKNGEVQGVIDTLATASTGAIATS
ncbi:MAG TPA: MBG domain-containing protein, partial [Alphaproteobacteria bacterium]|nr:MBG domain-containing protein [Alphaproteobacteria bacterium]